MKFLPPKSQRSPRAHSRKKKTIVRAGGHVLPGRVISYPDIYVGIGRGAYGGMQYAKCQIKLKRKCYRYLVWKHEGVQYSRYLGRVKILTLLSVAGTSSPARSTPASSGSRGGVRKKGVYGLRAAIAEQDGEE